MVHVSQKVMNGCYWVSGEIISGGKMCALTCYRDGLPPVIGCQVWDQGTERLPVLPEKICV